MARLFLFCIGGTGARVLKALTLMLGAGVDINATEIIPIIIDPDRENGDVNRTIQILDNYGNIRKKIAADKDSFVLNKFFYTPITTLNDLETRHSQGGAMAKSAKGFRFGIDGTSAGRFCDFININSIKDVNGSKSLIHCLFSERNLDAKLDVGFKGNPHMGSVVLNKFKDSEEFKAFASNFQADDRIFIVSSIFGGTGAAGFPLLVKNIREANLNNLSNPESLKDAAIGAITLLPYFGVKDKDESDIKKGTFVAKTKAALKYYKTNLLDNNSLNVLYMIGDSVIADYDNFEGASQQKNLAHTFEYFSALSIIDFMGISKDEEVMKATDGRALRTNVKEYGIDEETAKINFSHIGPRSKQMSLQAMTQFAYSGLYWERNVFIGFPTNIKLPWRKAFQDHYVQTTFLNEYLKRFWVAYKDWLEEMGRNNRSFMPFNLKVDDSSMETFIHGITQKKPGLMTGAKWNMTKFHEYVNGAQEKRDVQALSPDAQFLALFYQATLEIFNKRINK